LPPLTKIKEIIREASLKLKEVSGNPQLEAIILLEHILKISREQILVNYEESLKEEDTTKYNKIISKRIHKRIPLSYLIGSREFYSLKFITTPDVLIPRIETEGLVDLALDFLKKRKNPRILDIGTGSGNIIISIAKNYPKPAKFFASDTSIKALKIAKENSLFHKTRINFFCSNLFKAIKKKSTFDLIVSNPPYVSKKEYEKVSPEVKNEPKNALIANDNGIFFIKRIINLSEKYLKKNGNLIIEIGDTQKGILEKEFPFLSFHKDIFKRWRFISFEKK